MNAKIFKYLESNKRDVIDLVSRMIEIPTVNPPGQDYEKMVGLLEKQCKALGLKTRRYVTPKKVLDRFGVKCGSKRISLVADCLTGAKKTLHIASHYDIVPATDKWNTDPFKPVIKGNRIYGRGSEDMKGNIACVLSALAALRHCSIKPNINLQVSFTPDEEIGGGTGLGYLIKKGLVKADYAMSEGYSGNFVSMGNKGVLWAEIIVKGKASHASIPHKGINAFERMIGLASEFKKLQKRIIARRTRYRMRDSISRHPTFVMGGSMEGGVKVNVVPGTARFSIDRRVIPEENISMAKREISSVINRFNKRYRDSKASVKYRTGGEPRISRKNIVFFKGVSDSIKTVIGKKANFCIMPGATDIRYFMQKGIPALGYSARGGESWHSDNEFVYINSLVDTAKVYALVMTKLK